jgi:hypothetical protein
MGSKETLRQEVGAEFTFAPTSYESCFVRPAKRCRGIQIAAILIGSKEISRPQNSRLGVDLEGKSQYSSAPRDLKCQLVLAGLEENAARTPIGPRGIYAVLERAGVNETARHAILGGSIWAKLF